MTRAITIGMAVLCGLAMVSGGVVSGQWWYLLTNHQSPITNHQEVVLTFDKAETGKPTASYTDQGVVFALSRPPAKSKAAGRVMFSPHLKTDRKGILNAMANESIPVEVRFPKPVSSVTLVLWGSIGSAALVEAHDKDGKVINTAKRDKVPERTGPEQPVPSFELTVKGPAIASVRFSGAPPGGYLVCDEVRFTPRPDPRK
ncbi:MAG TPA: hypothetical protein VM597_26915 [Gemmataceae bacterium]|nr:hypothetical protein [Gemmataceae bacterium]